MRLEVTPLTIALHLSHDPGSNATMALSAPAPSDSRNALHSQPLLWKNLRWIVDRPATWNRYCCRTSGKTWHPRSALLNRSSGRQVCKGAHVEHPYGGDRETVPLILHEGAVWYLVDRPPSEGATTPDYSSLINHPSGRLGPRPSTTGAAADAGVAKTRLVTAQSTAGLRLDAAGGVRGGGGREV